MAKPKRADTRGVILTAEMLQLMGELNALIDYQKGSSSRVSQVTLNDKQWKCVLEDRKRKGWKTPRNCGFIEHYDNHSEYKGYRLVPKGGA